MSIKTLATQLIYANQWMRLREDKIRREDGSDGIYSVVERDDFVVVVPVQDGRITMVEQYRYPIQKRIWEMPMGCFEPDRHQNILAAAVAELREETGFIAATMLQIGMVYQGPGYCTQRGNVFFATGLTPGPTERDHGEMDMVTRDFTVAEVEEMIRNGGLVCSNSIAAFGMLRLRQLV